MQLRTIVFGSSVMAFLASVTFFWLTEPSVLRPSSIKPRQADLANGATMFNIGGCSSCHATPGENNRLKLGGGRALQSSFGVFNVPNISPDLQSGIGSWSELQFANAMLKGVGRQNEHLYPAFPYTSYQRMTLDDVRDLYAFLTTLQPDQTPSRLHQLPFPFNLRRAVGVWKWLFLDGTSLPADKGKGAAYNRGAYLVEAAGHCAECHSGRNMLGSIVPSKRFAGGVSLEGDGWVPNITSHADGLAEWSVADIATMLETGFTPDGSLVSGAMAEVIENTARASAADRVAMATYIKSLPPQAGKKPKPR